MALGPLLAHTLNSLQRMPLAFPAFDATISDPLLSLNIHANLLDINIWADRPACVNLRKVQKQTGTMGSKLVFRYLGMEPIIRSKVRFMIRH